MAKKDISKAPKKDISKDRGHKISFKFDGRTYSDTTALLELERIIPEETRSALNRAPAKYAYWAGLKADIVEAFRDATTDYEVWWAKVFYEAEKEYPARTAAGTIKNEVILCNVTEYKRWKKKLSELQTGIDKSGALADSFEIQSRTLQTVGGLLRREMEMTRE